MLNQVDSSSFSLIQIRDVLDKILKKGKIALKTYIEQFLQYNPEYSTRRIGSCPYVAAAFDGMIRRMQNWMQNHRYLRRIRRTHYLSTISI